MNRRAEAAHLPVMTQPTVQPGPRPEGQYDADFNTRQWRFVDFAVRKSCFWERDDSDARVLLIFFRGRPQGEGRSLALYPSGATGRGVRVALIDPSRTDEKSPHFISQRQAWAMIAEGL